MEDLTLQLDNLTMAVRNASLLNSTTAANQSQIADVYEPNLLDLYITPILSSLGLVGNSLAFIVMMQLSKESSFYLYLAVLALADWGVSLFGGFLVWLNTIGLLQLFGSTEQSWCSPIFTCTLISSQFSSWVTVAVSFDRYIAVCHPFKVASYCTRKRATITLVCLFLAIVALDSPMLCFEWNSDYTSCIFPPKSIDFCLKYLIRTDLPTYTLVPIMLITIFSLLIIRRITLATKHRHKLSNSKASGVKNKTAATRKTIILLMAVVLTFIVISLPLICMQVYILAVGDEDFGRKQPVVFGVINTLSVLTHVANFFLYGLSGKVFRDQLVKLFCRCRNG